MKEKRIAIVLTVLAIVITIIGSTFAYFTWATNASQNTAVTFTVTSGFSCSADGGGNITSQQKQLAPASCTNSTYAIQRIVTARVVNNTTGSVYLNMNLKVNSINANLSASQNFKYALTTSSNSCTTGVIASGSFNGAQANDTFPLLVEKEYQATNNNDQYYLYIWLDSAETNNNTQDQQFNISLDGSCSNHMAPKVPTTLTSVASTANIDNVASTYVTQSTGIKWYSGSSDTNGKGLYIRAGTENDTYPIYYYRGAVTDNNVLFAGFCWKIVRTTSTGGTKLIYNGIPSNGTCNNTGTDSQLASTSKFNNNYNSPADVGYMYDTRYTVTSQEVSNNSDVYMYATGYDETNHRLITTDAMNFAGSSWGTYYSQLNNNHYTCFNASGECNPVYYIYKADINRHAFNIQIPSGKTISGILNEMLTNTSNTTDSVIKTAVDTWYAANLTNYTSYLEDTPYCNDRSIYNLAGWSSTGNIRANLSFGSSGRTQSPYIPSLACSANDAFTVSSSNGNGKLTYPVGLLAFDEIRLAGSINNVTNNTYYLYTGQEWWSMSPGVIEDRYAEVFLMHTGGNVSSSVVNEAYGVRPVVSLKAGVTFSDGDGTANDPYVAYTPRYVYTVNASSSPLIGSVIPSTVTTYDTPEAAMLAFNNQPFFLRHVLDDDNKVTESYVGIAITPTMAAANPGMTAGIYYIKGYDTSAFVDNAKVLYDAFGTNCNSNPYQTTPSSSFSCYASYSGKDLRTSVQSIGYVTADDDRGSICSVTNIGRYGCAIM